MPNWVHNIVIPKDYEKFSKYVKSKDSDFDFNRICPRPASLNITSPSRYVDNSRGFFNDKNRAIFQKNRLDPILNNLYSDTITCENFVKLAKEFCKSINLDQEICKVYEVKDESMDIINSKVNYYEEIFMAYFNLRRYGFVDWYNWSVTKWGTKWNASDAMSYHGILTFDTAWSTPSGIWSDLAKKFDFVVLYADEDIGSNCGAIVAENGEEEYHRPSNDDISYVYARLVWDGIDYEDYDADDEDAYKPSEENRQQAQDVYNEMLEYWK